MIPGHCWLNWNYFVYIYRSESPSQVFVLLIQWLAAAISAGVKTDEMFLAYDNMCHLATMKAACRPLPLPPPLNDVWHNVTKIIDSFHLPNHCSKLCKEVYSPEPMKKKYPHFNTQLSWRANIYMASQFQQNTIINAQATPSFLLASDGH